MPKFQVDFDVQKLHTNGTIEVEADSQEDAENKVQAMPVEELIELTSGVDWVVDAWKPS